MLTSAITFEEEPVSAAEMAQRISEIQAASLPWLVATRDHWVAGFAYAHKWMVRAAYKYSTELTVYREGAFRRQTCRVGSAQRWRRSTIRRYLDSISQFTGAPP